MQEVPPSLVLVNPVSSVVAEFFILVFLRWFQHQMQVLPCRFLREDQRNSRPARQGTFPRCDIRLNRQSVTPLSVFHFEETVINRRKTEACRQLRLEIVREPI